jgi:hypothetical protein
VNWRLEFYSERRQTLAGYAVEAPAPGAALELGRRALLTEYSPTARRTQTLFEQAQRIGGQEADGWVLYRIAKDGYAG